MRRTGQGNGLKEFQAKALGASVYAAVLGLMAAGTDAARADDQEARAAKLTAASQPSSTVGIAKQIGDVKLNFRPYVETEAGLDTNPDNLFDQDGTGFVKLESGLKTTLERSNQYYALILKGRYLDYMDSAEEQNRKDFKAALDTSFTLSPAETFGAGTYFLRDLISLDRVDILHSYMEYAIREPEYRLKILAKNHTEHNFDNDVQGTATFDDFIVSRARAFDFSRSDAQVNLITFTKAMLQPFIIYDFGNIDFYNQTAGASIDRDAQENFGIAGVRLQLNQEFRIDVGYRLNYRDFDDRTVSSYRSDYIDVNMFWQAHKDLKFTAVIERYFDESTSSFGLVDDVQTYGVTLDWTIAPGWRLGGTAFYDRENAVGDDILYKKLTSTLSLTHDVNEHLEVFVSGLGKWVEEDVSGDSYDRYKIGSGLRYKY